MKRFHRDCRTTLLTFLSLLISGIIKSLGRLKEELSLTRYYTYRFMSIWKILLFLMCILFSIWTDGDEPGIFFQLFNAGFGPHNIVVEEVPSKIILHKFNLEESGRI